MSIKVEARYEFTADSELAGALATGAKKAGARTFKAAKVPLDHLSVFTRPGEDGYRVIVLARAFIENEADANRVLDAAKQTIWAQERATAESIRNEQPSVVATDADLVNVRESDPFD